MKTYLKTRNIGSQNYDAQRYFDKISKEWDTLYSNENKLMYFINRWLRKALYERYRLTFLNCGKIIGTNVLEVGCGTGRYCLEFAKSGATKVVGIDYAPQMISFAKQKAEEMGLADICHFVNDEFLTHEFDEQFDISIAIGLFDYIKDPEKILLKISSLTRRRFLATFPQDSLLWGTQRKIRYYFFKKCPIYFYTYEKLAYLLGNYFKDFKIIFLPHGFMGIGLNTDHKDEKYINI